MPEELPGGGPGPTTPNFPSGGGSSVWPPNRGPDAYTRDGRALWRDPVNGGFSDADSYPGTPAASSGGGSSRPDKPDIIKGEDGNYYSVTFNPDGSASAAPVYGIPSTPPLPNVTLIRNDDGSVEAVDSQSGATLWSRPAPPQAASLSTRDPSQGYTGDNGNFWVWDKALGQFVDTGQKAPAQDDKTPQPREFPDGSLQQWDSVAKKWIKIADAPPKDTTSRDIAFAQIAANAANNAAQIAASAAQNAAQLAYQRERDQLNLLWEQTKLNKDQTFQRTLFDLGQNLQRDFESNRMWEGEQDRQLRRDSLTLQTLEGAAGRELTREQLRQAAEQFGLGQQLTREENEKNRALTREEIASRLFDADQGRRMEWEMNQDTLEQRQKDRQLEAAKAFAESVNSVDPTALPAFLLAGGGNLGGGSLVNSFARGGNAITEEALKGPARQLEISRDEYKRKAYPGQAWTPSAPSSGLGGGLGGPPPPLPAQPVGGGSTSKMEDAIAELMKKIGVPPPQRPTGGVPPPPVGGVPAPPPAAPLPVAPPPGMPPPPAAPPPGGSTAEADRGGVMGGGYYEAGPVSKGVRRIPYTPDPMAFRSDARFSAEEEAHSRQGVPWWMAAAPIAPPPAQVASPGSRSAQPGFVYQGGGPIPNYEEPNPGSVYRGGGTVPGYQEPPVYAAEGFSGIVDKPTPFVVGERGPEMVNVKPLGEQGGLGAFVTNTKFPRPGATPLEGTPKPINRPDPPGAFGLGAPSAAQGFIDAPAFQPSRAAGPVGAVDTMPGLRNPPLYQPPPIQEYASPGLRPPPPYQAPQLPEGSAYQSPAAGGPGVVMGPTPVGSLADPGMAWQSWRAGGYEPPPGSTEAEVLALRRKIQPFAPADNLYSLDFWNQLPGWQEAELKGLQAISGVDSANWLADAAKRRLSGLGREGIGINY